MNSRREVKKLGVSASAFDVIHVHGQVRWRGRPVSDYDLAFRAKDAQPEFAQVLRLAGFAFAGMLLDGDGKPVAGARVFARALAGASSGGSTVTDADGRFRLDGLEPVRYSGIRSP